MAFEWDDMLLVHCDPKPRAAVPELVMIVMQARITSRDMPTSALPSHGRRHTPLGIPEVEHTTIYNVQTMKNYTPSEAAVPYH
jgi:hypothetical protein